MTARTFALYPAKSMGGGEWLVEVDIRGEKYKLLLDTGSDITNLTPKLVARLGVLHKIEPFGHAAGIGSKPVTVMGVWEPLLLLGKPIDKWLVFMGIKNEDQSEGLLGMDVLKQFKTFTIDNEQGELRVEEWAEKEECPECRMVRQHKMEVTV